MPVDPITLAVVRGSLEQIADEMDLLLSRAAFSTIVSEGHDAANGFYDAETGAAWNGGMKPPMNADRRRWAEGRVVSGSESAFIGGCFLVLWIC